LLLTIDNGNLEREIHVSDDDDDDDDDSLGFITLLGGFKEESYLLVFNALCLCNLFWGNKSNPFHCVEGMDNYGCCVLLQFLEVQFIPLSISFFAG